MVRLPLVEEMRHMALSDCIITGTSLWNLPEVDEWLIVIVSSPGTDMVMEPEVLFIISDEGV